VNSDSDPILIGRTWHFEDGTQLPLVSGGSDTGPVDQDLNSDPGFDIDLGEAMQQQVAPPADDLASGFLKNVREQDRPIVQQYVKDWDAGVTRRFQAIRDQYRPYEELGVPVEQIQGALSLMDLINEDPGAVMEYLGRITGGQPQQQQYQQQPQGFENPWAEEGVPDALAERFMQQEQILMGLAERFLESDNLTQEQQEAAELDDYLDELEAKHGNFNEDFVLAQLAKGLDGETAVKNWNQSIQEHINSRRSQKPPPAILGGSGSVPQGGVDPRKMSREETIDFVTKNLEAVNNQR
jgi:hypothetical protein